MNLNEALGISREAAVERLTLYIPSRDRNGNEFDQAPWVNEALLLLSGIGGGATAMPAADGAWLDPTNGNFIRERIVIIYTFIDPEKMTLRMADLRSFLHRLGRETNQGEVVCEFEGVLLTIDKFDP